MEMRLLIHDRGSIKWASLMLPEHVKALRDWRETEIHPMEDIPQFDEQAQEILNAVITEAFNNQKEVHVTYIENGQKHSFVGKIQSLDPLASSITFSHSSEQKKIIHTQQLIDIQL